MTHPKSHASKPKTVNSEAENQLDEGNVRIGQQIRDLRKAKGVTLSEMAAEIGRSVGYVSQVERGVSALPIPLLQSISEILDVNITWFFIRNRNSRWTK